MMYTCSECAVKPCTNHGATPYPANCPCRDQELSLIHICPTKFAKYSWEISMVPR